ncbi:sensor histidine kinase [Dactylosporangium vinaceum]|uniref:histidine kinase n=1 Tax=Dactylosporangium vinaceum TaxID=53362 RepID=A0ABV5MBS9_9ACTN|nr:histidine kinase [Dactylosporangium vinaceum]UAB98528.1 sensor histidine kinase [Dactylosporangium vinaceum]
MRHAPWASEHRAARLERKFKRFEERIERRRGRHFNGPHPVPLAIFIALIQVLGTRAAAYGTDGAHALDQTGYLLLLAGPAALLLRHKSPLLALAGALSATVAYFAMLYPNGPGFIAALVAVFGALSAGFRWLTWLGVIAAYTTYVVWVLPDASVGRLVAIGVWCVIFAFFGEGARVRGQRYAQMARDRAHQEALARAEEEKARKEQHRRQASDERLLIARELHDVIGHHLSLINVQAGVGLHLMDEQPEQARVALAAIKHASAEALRETRAVLAGLNPGEAAPRTPAPGLADLERLAGEARSAGLPVTVDTIGAARPVPPQVDRAAYRIVQEALTNVRRHAGPDATATVIVAYAPGELTLTVTDNGVGPAEPAPGAVAEAEAAPAAPGGAGPGGGNGIPGMRHRAATFGGSVEAGPRPDGGFAVVARIPLSEEETP